MNKSGYTHRRVLWKKRHHEACKGAEKLEHLLEVALAIIEDARRSGLPLWMVIGAMTTGGYGFERNMFLFERAVVLLEELGRRHGFLVFNQLPFQDAMIRILKFNKAEADSIGKGAVRYPQEIMDIFYKPLFRAARFNAVLPLPKADESKGALQERGYCEEIRIPLVPYPKELYEIAFQEMREKFRV